MSEERKYSAQEMREMVNKLPGDYSFADIVSSDGDKQLFSMGCLSSMLRQAANAEEELAQLKARLAAVVNECEKQIPVCRGEDCKCNPTDSGYCDENCHDEIIVHTAVTAILRVARGDGGAE